MILSGTKNYGARITTK